VLKVDMHFVHLWGIEFVLNMVVMLVVSSFCPNTNGFKPNDSGILDIHHWRYARPFGAVLVILTIAIYVWLGQ